jgi:NAD dependent epimerase/dehydratase family
MRLMVLGGTAFVGWAVVEAATARRWEVTTFNHGQSGTDVAGVEVVRGDRYDTEAIVSLRRRGPWDAVIDCSGYVPSNVLDVAQALAPSVGRYVFMSTVSVYADWPIKPLNEASTVLECPPDAGPDYGTDTEDGPTRYGYQKAGLRLPLARRWVQTVRSRSVQGSCWGHVNTSVGCRGGSDASLRVVGWSRPGRRIARSSQSTCGISLSSFSPVLSTS